MDIGNEEYFSIELITKGSFIDKVNDKLFTVTAYVIRLNSAALNEYINTTIYNDSTCFDTHEEYLEYIDQKRHQKDEFNRSIAVLLGIPPEGVTVSNAVSEVFTVTQILKVE